MSINLDDLISRFSPFAKLLGIRLEKFADGYSQCSLEIRDELRNIHRAAHGGVSYSLADVGMGVALYSVLEGDEQCTTIEIKINYLKPAADGHLICESRVIQKGKNIAVLEADVKNQDKLIAKAIGTFSIFNAKR